MARATLQTLVCHLRRIVGPPAGPAPSDADLLDRYVRERDSASFELLVWRHQRMVFSVCRRVLRNANDAEDAFQATFLTLVRKAGSISKRQALAGWLYQVAFRIACRSQADLRRRGRSEKQGVDLASVQDTHDDSAELTRRDLWPLLDEEINRLPAKYRDAVVLCYLEGKTYEEAAKQLRCPLGTLSTRLTRARELLRDRLTGRGLVLSAAALAGPLCTNQASATAPAALVANTILAVTRGCAVSAKVTALTQGVLHAMFLTKVKTVLVVTLALGVLGGGGAVLVPGAVSTAQVPVAGQLKTGQVVQDRNQGAGQTWQMRAVIPQLAKVLALSPDGKILASAGDKDDTVRLWDVATGKILWMLQSQHGAVQLLAFSPDGKSLATVGQVDDPPVGTIDLWDLQTKKILEVAIDGEKAAMVLQFSSDGSYFQTIDGTGVVKVRVLPTGKFSASFGLNDAAANFIAFSPDFLHVIGTRPGDPAVHLWDVRGAKTRRLETAVKQGAIAFSPNGKTLAIATNTRLQELLKFYGTGHPEVKAILRNGENNSVVILNLETGAVLRQFAPEKDGVTALAFSPDGKLLATAGQEKAIKLWDIESGKQIGMLNGHEGPVIVVIFAKDASRLFSSSADGTIRIWELSAAATKPDAQKNAIGARLDGLLRSLLKTPRTDELILEALCLATLARLPTDLELAFLHKEVAGKMNRYQAFSDVIWALVNSEEFGSNVEAMRMQIGAFIQRESFAELPWLDASEIYIRDPKKSKD